MDITLIKDLKTKHGKIIPSGYVLTVTPSKYEALKKSGHIEGDKIEEPKIEKVNKIDFKTKKNK